MLSPPLLRRFHFDYFRRALPIIAFFRHFAADYFTLILLMIRYAMPR